MKKPVKILLAAVIAVLLLLLGYVAYVLLSYHRLDDMLPLEVAPGAQAAAEKGTEYTLLSFNAGFGAYEDDYGFFMDGGSESRAWSKERLENNLAAISAMLKEQDADIYLMQEIDEDATRTYHFNEREFLIGELSGMSSVWAQNWDSPYLLYPLLCPHGSARSGLMTFSKLMISSALRRSLPVESSLMRLVDLDRCYSVSRMPVEGGELVIYDLHLSAYTSDGKIAEEQLKLLIADMAAEYAAGNYAVAGGDFNKDLFGDSSEIFGVSGEQYSWAQPLPNGIFSGTGLSLVVPEGEDDSVPSCRNADGPYNDGQFVLTVDGFIVSDNVAVGNAEVIDTGFAYSDHNPVRLTFELIP